MLNPKVESRNQVQKQSGSTIPTKAPSKTSKRASVKQKCREVENEGIIFPYCLCTLVKTDGGVPVYEDYKVTISFPQTWINASFTRHVMGGQGLSELCSSVPEGGAGWSPCLVMSYWKNYSSVTCCPGMQMCSTVFFSKHCRTAPIQYYLDGTLVTGETQQFLQLGKNIKQNVHLCVKSEKKPPVSRQL